MYPPATDDDADRPPLRPSPYSVEGYLAGFADFAAGATRATGWRRRVAVVVAWSILIPLGIGIAAGLLRLADMLIWR